MTNANTAKNNADNANSANKTDTTVNTDADTTTVENTGWMARNKKMLIIGAGLATVAAGLGAAAAMYKRATATSNDAEEVPVAAE